MINSNDKNDDDDDDVRSIFSTLLIIIIIRRALRKLSKGKLTDIVEFDGYQIWLINQSWS